MEVFLSEIGRHRLLRPAEEVQLAKQVERGSSAAREALILANLRLVFAIARRYQRPGVELADLVQEGTLGLMRAVARYDWRRGCRFSTYAGWWIRAAVRDAARREACRPRVADRPDAELELPDDSPSLEDELDREALHAKLERALAVFPYAQREVVRLRYGLGEEPHRFDAVGRALGLPASRARTIHGTALHRLERDTELRELARAA